MQYRGISYHVAPRSSMRILELEKPLYVNRTEGPNPTLFDLSDQNSASGVNVTRALPDGLGT